MELELKKFQFTDLDNERGGITLTTGLFERTVIFMEETDENGNKVETNEDSLHVPEKRAALSIQTPNNQLANKDFRSTNATYLVVVQQTSRGIKFYKTGTAVHIGAGNFLTAAHVLKSCFPIKPVEVVIRLYKCDPFTTTERMDSLKNFLRPNLSYTHFPKAFSGEILKTFEVKVVAHLDEYFDRMGWIPESYRFSSRHLDLSMLAVIEETDTPGVEVRPGVYQDQEPASLTGINGSVKEEDFNQLYMTFPEHISRKELKDALEALLPLQKSTATGRSAKCTQLNPAGKYPTDKGGPSAVDRLIISEIAAVLGISGGGLFSKEGWLVGIHLGGTSFIDTAGNTFLTYPRQHSVSINLSNTDVRSFLCQHHLPKIRAAGRENLKHWESFLSPKQQLESHQLPPKTSFHSLKTHGNDSQLSITGYGNNLVRIYEHTATHNYQSSP